MDQSFAGSIILTLDKKWIMKAIISQTNYLTSWTILLKEFYSLIIWSDMEISCMWSWKISDNHRCLNNFNLQEIRISNDKKSKFQMTRNQIFKWKFQRQEIKTPHSLLFVFLPPPSLMISHQDILVFTSIALFFTSTWCHSAPVSTSPHLHWQYCQEYQCWCLPQRQMSHCCSPGEESSLKEDSSSGEVFAGSMLWALKEEINESRSQGEKTS